jgi:hypothetical protein
LEEEAFSSSSKTLSSSGAEAVLVVDVVARTLRRTATRASLWLFPLLLEVAEDELWMLESAVKKAAFCKFSGVASALRRWRVSEVEEEVVVAVAVRLVSCQVSLRVSSEDDVDA